uniref:Importin-7/11-like TPR repeats domain-containing protein n=1 Tax=Hanusia phi TaxID=3032 RepID=A0A7S0EMS9_9CRYP
MSECGPSAYFALSIIDALLCRYGSSALNVLVVLQREMLEARPVSFQVIEADLVREACYHVIGSACMTLIKAKDLFEQVAVVNMAGSYLQNEFEIFNGQQGERHPALVLALRRAVWMLGKLVKAEVSEEGSSSMKERSTDFSPLHSTLVPLIYSALEFPVIAVQVAAAASLVIEPEDSDDWFDRTSLLLPQGDLQAFLPAICATILKVSSAEDNLEVKNVSVRMLRGLASQIDSKNDQGSSFFQFLLPTISSLWLIIGSERRLQVSLLHLILDSSNEDVMRVNPDVFCQIIEAALAQDVLNEASTPAGGGSVILMETAADLWLKLLSSASSVEKHSTLFARILASLRISRGPRETLLRVFEAYLLLGGFEFCQHLITEISFLLSNSCREMNLRELRWSLNICEVSLALGPAEVYDKFAGLLMVATAHVMLHKAGDTVAAALFSCLAGLTFLIGSEEPILGILAEVNKQEGANLSLEQLLDVWLETWDACLTLERRRINCLGLARLLGCGSPALAQRMSVVLNFLVDFNGEELVEEERTRTSSTSLQICRKQLWRRSYVQEGGLAAFFRSMMEMGRLNALNKYGEEGKAFFDENIKSVDPQLMSQLA